MNTKRLIFVVALAFVCMAGMAQNFRANMDPSVKPGDAFNIQPTDKMFIPKEKRALVW